jgi:hypothetical protein
MTIRRAFERKKRRVMAAALFGVGLGAAGAVLAQWNLVSVPPYVAAVPGGAVMTLALLYAQWFAFYCPRCRGRWGDLAMRGCFFEIDPRIRYCPYCGADVDAGREAFPP